ncbi:MAG: hypothetical protein KDI98_07625 [Hyphomicrobiaceae bacterium]|nr:hypothetical protein [Hyphomicrobiaceae bacterium]
MTDLPKNRTGADHRVVFDDFAAKLKTLMEEAGKAGRTPPAPRRREAARCASRQNASGKDTLRKERRK